MSLFYYPFFALSELLWVIVITYTTCEHIYVLTTHCNDEHTLQATTLHETGTGEICVWHSTFMLLSIMVCFFLISPHCLAYLGPISRTREGSITSIAVRHSHIGSTDSGDALAYL